MVTLSIKSGGVPGLTVCRITPSWCECISVSSKSNTKTFLLTKPKKRKAIISPNPTDIRIRPGKSLFDKKLIFKKKSRLLEIPNCKGKNKLKIAYRSR